MERKVNSQLARGIVKNLKYIPVIIGRVKNWPTYFLYYLGLRQGGGKFIMRNGAVIQDVEGTASGTIAVVFVRNHYGSVKGMATILEIGANIGVFAIYAATENPHVTLYSYEPAKANYDVLVKNIERNGYCDRVKTFNFGAAARTEDRVLNHASSPLRSFSDLDSAAAGETISCLSLSDILSRHKLAKVDLLKINAEGAEYEILYNSDPACFKKIDEIRLEYHKHDKEGFDLENLQNFLESHGYVRKHLYRQHDDEGFLWMSKLIEA